MDQFNERIAKLSPAKRALLERALQQDEEVIPRIRSIPQRDRNQPAVLSFGQQRLWFLSKLEPASAAYNQPKTIRLEGSLDIETLRMALDAIVARHEALRTVIVSQDDETPVQAVTEARATELPIIDLTECAKADLEAELGRRLREEVERPFDLTRDMMLRAMLVKVGLREHVLLLVTHHIASDGWSTGILWQELAALYGAFLKGEPSPLAELPIQYADYAVWQRQWLQGEVLERQLSYWKGQLSGISVLELPTDRPRPAVQSYRGSRESIELSDELTRQLKTLSRKEGVTLFMTLLAAFQTLLQRYCGQEDIAVGSPIAGRTRSETERLIGFFVNTLVLRSDLSSDPTFRELLGRVRKMALEAYEHQDIPFEKLVEELHPERDLSRSPLFQVMFAFQNVPRYSRELPGLTASPVEITNETAKFDLSLYIWEERAGLKARLEYNTDLYDAATVNRMLGHFNVLLQGIVANPDQRLSALPMLTEAERRQLLIEWNDTEREYPRDRCVHELFEAQVERSPDAVAVVFEDKQLTYRELNARANQVAHYLIKLGVGPETLVGICMERSLEMVVGLLGILKAGGAYVPLDPAYPKERLEFMLQDAQVQVLLTQQSLSLDLRTDPRTQLLCLDRDWATVAEQQATNPHNKATPENLAYVIYTSGSTGLPKGV
ncbi:MAG: condensation domain-containing protein, partial [Alphaproteobacteria bacterium]